jgi:hypothetical protein
MLTAPEHVTVNVPRPFLPVVMTFRLARVAKLHGSNSNSVYGLRIDPDVTARIATERR